MAKDRESRKRKQSYARAPEITDSETLDRFTVALQVMNGELSMSEAARMLGLTRIQMQTLVHRAQAATLAAVMPQARGRPRKTEQVRQLEHTNRRLRQQLEQAQRELSQKNALLQTASEVLRDRACIEPRRVQRRSRTTLRMGRRRRSEAPDDVEPTDRALERAERLRRAGVSDELASAIVGAGRSTLRRWRARQRAGMSTRARRGRGSRAQGAAAELAARAVGLVRELRGVIGAEPLRRAVPGLSRRQAAEIKAETVRTLERERKAACARVRVTEPGAVRGFDAMYLETLYGRQYILAAADACVPYRTSLARADRYDATAVAVTLERDFRRHGAPLAVRLDRASVHRAPSVCEVCARFGVVMVHGPPHLARFYGQLERQNREHREWLKTAEIRDPEELERELDLMRTQLNDAKPRRSLDWDTAAKRWARRRDFGPPNALERQKFRSDVDRLTDRIASALDAEEPYDGFAHRLAAQAALIERGLLRLSRTGGC